jgi:hypothetical protein
VLGLLIAYTIVRRLHILRVLALGLVVGALALATHAASHIQGLGSQRSINHAVMKMRHGLTHDLEHVLKAPSHRRLPHKAHPRRPNSDDRTS